MCMNLRKLTCPTGRKSAIKYLSKLGFHFDRYPRHMVTIIETKSNDGIFIENCINFRANTKSIVRTAQLIHKYGKYAEKLTKALIAAVNESDTAVIDALVTNCRGVRRPENLLSWLYVYIVSQIETQNVYVNQGKFTKNNLMNIYCSLGDSHEALKAFFMGCILTFLTAFDKWHSTSNVDLSKTMSNIMGYDAPLIGDIVKVDKCSTCFHAKWKNGQQLCTACKHVVDENLSYKQIKELYPEIKFDADGQLVSKYVLYDMDVCEYYESRIIQKTKRPSFKTTDALFK